MTNIFEEDTSPGPLQIEATMNNPPSPEPEVVAGTKILHIGSIQRTAKVKKTNTATKHLAIFIEKYQSQFSNLLPSCPDPSNLPYDVVNNEEFVGCFVNYLASEATPLDKSKDELLSLATVAGYASSFCTYYLHHYRNEEKGPPNPLRSDLWHRKMAKLTQCKQDHHHKMGTKIKGDKETATNEDRVNLAKVCILEGSSTGSEMFHISNTAVTLAGRGSDVADSKISHIRSHKQVDDLLEYPILIQDTIRFKTSTTSDHRIFPHRDSFYLCYYFSLAYLLIVGSSKRNDNNLFPSFCDKVYNANKQVDSKVATFFNKCIDHFWQLMYDYAKGTCIVSISNYT